MGGAFLLARQERLGFANMYQKAYNLIVNIKAGERDYEIHRYAL